jgi:hypothetical protein
MEFQTPFDSINLDQNNENLTKFKELKWSTIL